MFFSSNRRFSANSVVAALKMNGRTKSGPAALYGFRLIKSLCTPFQSAMMPGMDDVVLRPFTGTVDVPSFVNSVLNYSLRMLTLDMGSLWRKPLLFFSGATPVDSWALLFMYCMTRTFLSCLCSCFSLCFPGNFCWPLLVEHPFVIFCTIYVLF